MKHPTDWKEFTKDFPKDEDGNPICIFGKIILPKEKTYEGNTCRPKKVGNHL